MRDIVVVDRQYPGEIRFYFPSVRPIFRDMHLGKRYSLDYAMAEHYTLAEAKKIVNRLRDFSVLAEAIRDYGLSTEHRVYPVFVSKEDIAARKASIPGYKAL